MAGSRNKILIGAIFAATFLAAVLSWVRRSPRLEGEPARRTTTTATRPSDGREEPRDLLNQVAATSHLIPLRRDVEGQPALVTPDVSELSTTDRPPLADSLGAPSTKPEAEPGIVLDILNAFRRAFGSYPAAEDNHQFVNALLGANKSKLPFVPRDHTRLNADGEIIDAWGTPFFFHLNSSISIEVRSAGPDRSFYTADDIVAGRGADQNQSKK